MSYPRQNAPILLADAQGTIARLWLEIVARCLMEKKCWLLDLARAGVEAQLDEKLNRGSWFVRHKVVNCIDD